MNIAKKLLEGKKIRRERWKQGHYWKLKDGEIVDSSGCVVNDFEIVEEKKTLSDKIIDTSQSASISDTEKFHRLKAEDVKESIKEFIDFIETMTLGGWNKTVRDKAKEIFGERLI